MGRGGNNVASQDDAKAVFSWDEVKEHSLKTDKWLVINDQVYDITQWSRRHPGGSRVISHYAGQDATEAFRAFHNDVDFVSKFMKPLHRGSVTPQPDAECEVKRDMDVLRNTAHRMGLFKPSVLFYILHLGHILLLEVLGYLILRTYGTGWLPLLASLLCLVTVQAQTGWTQHDFGHLSVMGSSKLNHFIHIILMNVIKGACSGWWNHLHYQHHAKPNCMEKDPDVRLDALFVFGESMAKKAAKNKNPMPYDWQQHYFFAIGPPLLFPIYFQYMVFKYPFVRRQWWDIFLMSLYYLRYCALYVPLLGVGGALLFYFLIRVLESHWFVWVSQSNHIPMEIDVDKARPWLALQLHATCNIRKSAFNDWFTGHLNFQIEHHLFPTMPRHNLYKIAPLVKSLCHKHDIAYTVKPLTTAFADVVRQLKNSGEIWSHYYNAYH